jgi:hypothetical protein
MRVYEMLSPVGNVRFCAHHVVMYCNDCARGYARMPAGIDFAFATQVHTEIQPNANAGSRGGAPGLRLRV